MTNSQGDGEDVAGVLGRHVEVQRTMPVEREVTAASSRGAQRSSVRGPRRARSQPHL